MDKLVVGEVHTTATAVRHRHQYSLRQFTYSMCQFLGGLWVRSPTFRHFAHCRFFFFFRGLNLTASKWKHHQSLICNTIIHFLCWKSLPTWLFFGNWKNWQLTCTHRSCFGLFGLGIRGEFSSRLQTFSRPTSQLFGPIRGSQKHRASDLWQRARFEGGFLCDLCYLALANMM